MRPEKFYVCDQKVYVYLMKKFCNERMTKVRGCFRFIAKKSHGRLITAAILVLLFSLGKFGHALDVDLQKIKVIYC